MMGRLSAWIVQMLLVACFCRNAAGKPSVHRAPGSGSTRSLEDELLRLTACIGARGAPLIVDENLTVIAREQSMGMAAGIHQPRSSVRQP